MTQRERVLHMLRVAPGRKVTSEQFLAAGIPRYSARIWELRDLGFRISTTPRAHSKTVTFRLEFDVERDSGVERGDGPVPFRVASSEAVPFLSADDGGLGVSAYGHAIALPRTRRRKRRPPTPLERTAIACFSFQVLITVGSMVSMAAMGDGIGVALNLLFLGTIIRFTSWPHVWNYIVNGWEDED